MFMAEDRAAVSSETQSVYHIDDVISQKIMAGYIWVLGRMIKDWCVYSESGCGRGDGNWAGQ